MICPLMLAFILKLSSLPENARFSCLIFLNIPMPPLRTFHADIVTPGQTPTTMFGSGLQWFTFPVPVLDYEFVAPWIPSSHRGWFATDPPGRTSQTKLVPD
jgi:hypothetical protein